MSMSNGVWVVIEDEDQYLSHHGILGMKWGQRNGPPYPLSSGAHSAREKKAGWRKSLDKDGKVANASKKKKNASVTKSAAKAAYGAYKKAKTKLDPHINKAKSDYDAYKRKKENRKERLRAVDPELAKNKETRRVAYDYHILDELQFRRKYRGSKKKFAKRYLKTNGDTYSLGKRKALRGAVIVARSGDIPIYGRTDRNGNQFYIKMGREKAARLLASDLASAQIKTKVGFNKAQKAYYEKIGKEVPEYANTYEKRSKFDIAREARLAAIAAEALTNPNNNGTTEEERRRHEENNRRIDEEFKRDLEWISSWSNRD